MHDWLLIAHGTRAGRDAYAPLVNALAARLGAHPVLATLDEETQPPAAQRALALLVCAGGHRDEAETVAARAGARFVGPLPSALVAQAAMVAAESAFGRRAPVLFLVHDWQSCETLVAELYAHTRIFTYPVIAAWRGAPSLMRVLLRWRQEEAKPLAVQPVLVAEGAWREDLYEAARQAGVELRIGNPLAACDAFIDALAEWMQEVD